MYVFEHPIKKDQSNKYFTSKLKSNIILALSRSTIYNKHNNIVFCNTNYEIYFYFYISHLYKIIKYPDDLTKTSPYPYRFIRIDHNSDQCNYTPLCSIQPYNQSITMWHLKLIFLQTNINSHRKFL